MRLRTFVEEQPVAVSPDGQRVAYVLIEPNLEKDYDETVVYVRDLPAAGVENPPRESGRAVLRTRGIRQVQWLADGRHLLVLHHPGGERGEVVRADVASGEASPASPSGLDVEEFAATPDGRRLALLVSVPDQEQADRFASPRGVPINEDDFLLDIDARGTTKKKASRTAVVAADAGGGTMTVFSGKRSLALMRPAISPDGRYVTFHALGEALPYPAAGKKIGLPPVAGSGATVPQNELLRADFRRPSRRHLNPARTRLRSDSRSTLAASVTNFGTWRRCGATTASPTWCAAPARSAMAAPVDEALVGPYRPHHLFTVDARTGTAQRVMEEPPEELLAFDEQAQRIILKTRSGDLVTLRRADPASGEWKEEQRTKLPNSGLSALAMVPGDTRRFAGIHQTTTEPPDLWLLDVKTGHKAALTEINPELREQTLGRVEKIEWSGSNASKNWGYVIYPVGYETGTRYPCAILCKSWDDTFIHGGNDGLRSNFAPQALANGGFVVLLLADSIGPYPKGTWKNLPGGVSEAFRGMDAFESARRELDRRGLIDPARVAIMGFSRSSWIVDFTLTHSAETWAAAVSADSGIYNYGTYLGDKNLRSGMAAMYGGPPSGDTFKAWLDYAPAFSAEHVRTPLLMQYHNKISMAAEFYSALITQGKPVELVLFPEGQHILERPWQRAGSMQGSVDWFRFWLQGYENPSPQYLGSERAVGANCAPSSSETKSMDRGKARTLPRSLSRGRRAAGTVDRWATSCLPFDHWSLPGSVLNGRKGRPAPFSTLSRGLKAQA